MFQGDFDEATANFTTLLKQEPTNVDFMTDYCYLLNLKKDYPKATLLSKEIAAHPKATVESYQVVGIVYKATQAYTDAEQVYRKGIAKYPNSGVLYNEYGEMFAMQNKFAEAIIQWEAGIKADPNYSNNYYNATMYYSKIKIDLFWATQYGEIFVNLESYSSHTNTIKAKLAEAYKQLFAGNALDKLAETPNISAFEKAWIQTIGVSSNSLKTSLDVQTLIAARTKFIIDWYFVKQNEKTPFHLFDHQQYLVKEGFFEAYNQWLFGEAFDSTAYTQWANTHGRELGFYKAYQQSKIYKQPTGEYYH